MNKQAVIGVLALVVSAALAALLLYLDHSASIAAMQRVGLRQGVPTGAAIAAVVTAAGLYLYARIQEKRGR